MSTDTNELLASLARARAEFEARLQMLPQWRALQELEKSGADGDAQVRREALVAELRGDPVYQGWVEIGLSMSKLAAGAGRGAPAAAASGSEPVFHGPPDDLKRIRGITQQHSVVLHRLGIRRFSEIARWSAVDVARVSAALGLKDEISRQNWIEQAAARHLSQGGRLEDRAPVAEAPAVAKAETARPQVAAPVTVVGAQSNPEAVPPGDDLTRIRGIRAPLAEALGKLGVTQFVDIANWTAGDVTRIAAALGLGDRISRESWIEQAAMRVPAGALRVAAPVSRASDAGAAGNAAASVALAVATEQTQAAAAAEGDDLTLIRGIRAAVADKLKANGITRFETIANWTAADVQRIAGELGLGDRINREGWIEQAAARFLAQGGKLKPAAPIVAQRAEPQPPAAVVAAVQPIAETPREIREPAPAAAAAPAVKAADTLVSAAAPPVPPAFASALAAIKSELAAPVPAAMAAVAEVAAKIDPRPAAANADRLELISGIDARIAKKLNVLGVLRFADIAAWRAGDVQRFEAMLGLPGAVSQEGWIEQAAVLARGGMTAHAARVDNGDIGALAAYPRAALAPLPRPDMAMPLVKPAAADGAGAQPVPPIEARTAPPPSAAQRPLPQLPPSIAVSPQAASSAGLVAAVVQQPAAAAQAAMMAATAAAKVREAAEPQPQITPAPLHVPPPMPISAAAATAQPGAGMPAPGMPATPAQWPSMTSAPLARTPAPAAAATPPPLVARSVAPTPAPLVAQTPMSVDVNAMPGPADPVPPLREPRSVEARAEMQALEGGLAAALATAAATASVSPRLVPGHLGEQIRTLPGAADPYLEDLSDWVQDTAEEFAGSGELVREGGEEAAVSIVRRAAEPGDLGALTPGSDGVFDGTGYAAYRRYVGEASVDIVRADAEGGDALGAAVAAPAGGAPGQPERGLRRLMRAIRGDPKGR